MSEEPKTFLEVAANVIGEAEVARIMNQPFESMVERVARALCVNAGEDPDSDWRVWECANGEGGITLDVIDDHPERWRQFASQARAALAAMREPTEGMVDFACRATGFAKCPALAETVTETWQAMIDAALQEPKK